MDYFVLNKPKISQEDRVKTIQSMEIQNIWQQLAMFISKVNEPDYLDWDSAKHKKPLPAGLSPEQSWYAVKLLRTIQKRNSPISSPDGHAFGWIKLNSFERICHEFDLNTGGELISTVGDLKPDEKKRLISKGLMDEAIASAQLEGADTARAYAQKMLREKIKPRNESDWMILNSHKAMLMVESTYQNQDLSLDLILEMHALLTENTKDSVDEVPRLRQANDEINVQDNAEGVIYHTAPDIKFVKKELAELIDYANDDAGDFIHPLIKASMLHFWMGYLHPFTDGNGRMARLIFYWYLLRHGYWAFAYLPIAAKIKQAGKKSYTMAYVYSEQDDYDLTYFISYLLKKCMETYNAFQEYVKSQRKANVQMAYKAREKYGLNERQIQLLNYLSATTLNSTTVASHKTINGISRATAINDLSKMLKLKLLMKNKSGRTIYYYKRNDIPQK